MVIATQDELNEIQLEIDRLRRLLPKCETQRSRKLQKLNSVISALHTHPDSAGLKNKRLKLATQIEGHSTYHAEINKIIVERIEELAVAKAKADSMLLREKSSSTNLARQVGTWHRKAEILRSDEQIFERDSLMYDVFVSHASEDKEPIVRPLVSGLHALGLRVWFDEFELKLGDSLRRSIDNGLRQSRFGVVVLSKAFFAKQWPQYELDSLVAREIEEGRVILPIWHGVSKADVMQFSPRLGDKVAASTEGMSTDDIALQVYRALH